MRNHPITKILLTTAAAWSINAAVAAPNGNLVNQMTSGLISGYLSEAELEKVVAAEGACPATQLLRDKKAFR